jgi:hypothetical protein
MSLSSIRRVNLTIREYYQQYCLPAAVSTHRLYLSDHDLEVVSVKIVPNPGIIHYYRVKFTDDSEIVIPKDHQCVVEILPGVLRNR